MSRITIFDKPYSNEKVQEALKVQNAVLTGKCNFCRYLQECESNDSFAFPTDAPCME